MAGIIGGRFVALAISLIFFSVAAAHVWKALTQKYADHFVASDHAMLAIHLVAMTGLIARGVILAALAVLFFHRFLPSGGWYGRKPAGT